MFFSFCVCSDHILCSSFGFKFARSSFRPFGVMERIPTTPHAGLQAQPDQRVELLELMALSLGDLWRCMRQEVDALLRRVDGLEFEIQQLRDIAEFRREVRQELDVLQRRVEGLEQQGHGDNAAQQGHGDNAARRNLRRRLWNGSWSR